MKKVGKLLVGLQFLFILLIAYPAGVGESNLWLKIIGYTIFALGAVVITRGTIAIRPSLTALPEPKEGAPLITSGIYRYIRHPMYAGLILMGLGLTLARDSSITGIETILLYFLLTAKYRYEDYLLRQRWPAAKNYQARVGALIPKTLKSKI